MDSHAETFDAMSIDPLWLAFSPAEEALVAAFLTDWRLHPGLRVLEPGCGTGRLTEKLAAAVAPGGIVVACDPSPAMIAAARQRGLPAHASFHQCTLTELPAGAGPFDRILCFNVLPHLQPIDAHLALLRRHLAPGGELWVNHTASRAFINGIHAAAGMPDHLLPDLTELRRLAQAAGLRALGGADQPGHFVARYVHAADAC
jgi:demethylmenaquinone methyltransferase/2-methoxy-6-polyprenyl-1,4-benzoquinol methylase